MALKVAVSPWYIKDAFYDEVSGINFEKSKASAIYPYEIAEGTNLDGIRKAVRLHILMLLEGQLPEQAPVTAEKPVVEAPKEEALVTEEVQEEVSEPAVEAPKSKGTKKVSK
jgi:hypothetical protein